MEEIREELLLLRSSVPETDFIWNDSLMSDKAQSDWEVSTVESEGVS